MNSYSQELKPLIPVPKLREWISPGYSQMIAPDSHFPFPNCRNGFFLFPSSSRCLGMIFYSTPVPKVLKCFISLPFPNFGDVSFQFPSHSRTWGAEIFIPFPFLNSNKSFPLIPVTEGGLAIYHLGWGWDPREWLRNSCTTFNFALHLLAPSSTA